MVKRADKKLFEPIISPVKDMDRVRGRVSQVKCDLVKIMDRYLPWLSTIPLELGLVWLAMTFWARDFMGKSWLAPLVRLSHALSGGASL